MSPPLFSQATGGVVSYRLRQNLTRYHSSFRPPGTLPVAQEHRAYSTSSEEALLVRNLLKDWADEGFLTEAQYHRMEQETGCDLRRTNIFLRLVLFLFTVIIVGGASALLFLL